jgi:hypothetical protein
MGVPGGSGGIKIEPVFLFGCVLRGNRKSEGVEKLQSISVPRGELGLVNKSWAELTPTRLFYFIQKSEYNVLKL